MRNGKNRIMKYETLETRKRKQRKRNRKPGEMKEETEGIMNNLLINPISPNA